MSSPVMNGSRYVNGSPLKCPFEIMNTIAVEYCVCCNIFHRLSRVWDCHRNTPDLPSACCKSERATNDVM